MDDITYPCTDSSMRVWRRGRITVLDIGRNRWEKRYQHVDDAIDTAFLLADEGACLASVQAHALRFRFCRMPSRALFRRLRAAVYDALMGLVMLDRFARAMYCLGAQLRFHRADGTERRFLLLDMS